MHVASAHQYDAADRTFAALPGSCGVLTGASRTEGRFELSWASNTWNDMLD